jgi:hypothetical protein
VRNVRLWRGLLGVDRRTVIEDIEVSQEGAEGVSWWWRGCGHEARCHAAVGAAAARRPSMTAVRDRAYLLKEGLRHVFSVKGQEGKQALDRWISSNATSLQDI